MDAERRPDADTHADLRRLPSVDALLHAAAIARLRDEFPRSELLASIRTVLEERRTRLRTGQPAALDLPALALDVRAELHRRRCPSLRRVINATGVVLHTGLGRAPLAAEAVEAITDVATGYCNLEFDLEDGQRGDRQTHLRALLCELTGAEDALVVNNNAAATFLTLHALAATRGVIISRGQLVEIGGSYRMPDVMAAAGCRMVEVGTTNRTHLRDYAGALDPQTSVLLRVHTSNYRVTGFTHEVTIRELAELAARQRATQDIFVVDDLGSGLIDTSLARPGATDTAGGPPADAQPDWDEPSVRDSVAAGADVTLFSGDKLLGGPQAGIIVGRAALLARLRSSPLMRTHRPDKLTLAGLEATLRLYRDPEALGRRLPVHRMLLAPLANLRAAAEDLARRLSGTPGYEVRCQPDVSYAGGGSLPTAAFQTWTVRLRPDRAAPEDVARMLRQHDPAVIVRLQGGELVLDCRTLLADDLEQVVAAFATLARD